MVWSCSVEAPACAGDDSDDRDDSRVHVENAHFSIMPDAGLIDLFDTLDAVDQKMANVGEMLTINRPDLMPESGMEWSGTYWCCTPCESTRSSAATSSATRS